VHSEGKIGSTRRELGKDKGSAWLITTRSNNEPQVSLRLEKMRAGERLFAMTRNDFEKIRTEKNDPSLSDLDCFIESTNGKKGESFSKVRVAGNSPFDLVKPSLLRRAFVTACKDPHIRRVVRNHVDAELAAMENESGGWSPDSLTYFADAAALFFAQRRRAEE